MTRGILTIFALVIVVSIWLGYLVQINKMEKMTLKDEVTALKSEITSFKEKVKALVLSNGEKDRKIMDLEKEYQNQKTLNDLLRDKIAQQTKKNGVMIKINHDGLKELRTRIDSLMLFNLEQHYQDDGQNRKPTVPTQGEIGTESTGN